MTDKRDQEEKLLAIGRALAAREGLPWMEPVSLHYEDTQGAWVLVTNALSRGRNLRITIDADSASVIDHAFLPR